MWEEIPMRLRADMAIRIRRIEKQELARRMGVDPTVVSRILRWMDDIEHSVLPLRTVMAFCDQLNIRLEWLVYGIGEMERIPTQKAGEASPSAPPAPVSRVPTAASIPAVAPSQRKGRKPNDA